jgi:hypothetical protein
VLRIFELNIIRKIYGPGKEEEVVEIRKNKEIRDILQRTDTVKFIKPLRLRQNGHVDRMQQERMPQRKIATATLEGTRKKENHVKGGWMRWKRGEICSR